jgi:hypothetical protein
MVARRLRALQLDGSDEGFQPTEDLPRVFSGLIDMAYQNDVATLVSLVDGTTRHKASSPSSD